MQFYANRLYSAGGGWGNFSTFSAIKILESQRLTLPNNFLTHQKKKKRLESQGSTQTSEFLQFQKKIGSPTEKVRINGHQG